MNFKKKNIVFLTVLSLGLVLFLDSCKEKKITCAAYNSAFFHTEELAYSYYFILDADSTPKGEKRDWKGAHGLAKKSNENPDKLMTFKMKMRKTKNDTSGIIAIQEEDDDFFEDGGDSLATANGNSNAAPDVTSYNYNTDMQSYYFYIGQYLETVESVLDSNAMLESLMSRKELKAKRREEKRLADSTMAMNKMLQMEQDSMYNSMTLDDLLEDSTLSPKEKRRLRQKIIKQEEDKYFGDNDEEDMEGLSEKEKRKLLKQREKERRKREREQGLKELEEDGEGDLDFSDF